MILIELIKISRDILKTLSDFDIKTDDVKYVDLYCDYEKMVNRGEKVTYIVELLAQRYDVSTAKVYRIIRKFKRAVKV